MTIQEFAQYLKGELEKTLQEGEIVQVKEQIGNNQVKKLCIIIKKIGKEDFRITNIEKYYRSLLAGDVLKDIVSDILNTVQLQSGYKILEGNRSDWKNICNQVIYQLIHYGRNMEELADKAYIQWQEFAIIFYIIELENKDGYYYVPITKNDLNMWKIDVETLYRVAAQNTPMLLPLQVDNLLDIMAATSIWEYDAEMMNLMWENTPPVYVLSNIMHTYGATVVLYEGVLKDFSVEIGHDFYLIPFSVNEFLAISSQNTNPDELRKLHRAFLAIHADKEHWLSDEIYLYRVEYDDVVWIPEQTTFS